MVVCTCIRSKKQCKVFLMDCKPDGNIMGCISSRQVRTLCLHVRRHNLIITYPFCQRFDLILFHNQLLWHWLFHNQSPDRRADTKSRASYCTIKIRCSIIVKYAKINTCRNQDRRWSLNYVRKREHRNKHVLTWSQNWSLIYLGRREHVK